MNWNPKITPERASSLFQKRFQSQSSMRHFMYFIWNCLFYIIAFHKYSPYSTKFLDFFIIISVLKNGIWFDLDDVKEIRRFS